MPLVRTALVYRRSAYSLSPFAKVTVSRINFSEHGTTALTNHRIIFVLANMGGKIPTAFALQSRSFAHLHQNWCNAIPRSLFYFDGGDNKKVTQVVLEALEDGEHGIRRAQIHLRLKIDSDQLLDAGLFERLQNRLTNSANRLPVFRQLGSGIACSRFRAEQAFSFRERCQVHAFQPACKRRQILPNLFAGKTHDRSQQPYERFADAPDRRLRRAPGHGLRSRGVKAVFQYVEVERA